MAKINQTNTKFACFSYQPNEETKQIKIIIELTQRHEMNKGEKKSIEAQ